MFGHVFPGGPPTPRQGGARLGVMMPNAFFLEFRRQRCREFSAYGLGSVLEAHSALNAISVGNVSVLFVVACLRAWFLMFDISASVARQRFWKSQLQRSFSCRFVGPNVSSIVRGRCFAWFGQANPDC